MSSFPLRQFPSNILTYLYVFHQLALAPADKRTVLAFFPGMMQSKRTLLGSHFETLVYYSVKYSPYSKHILIIVIKIERAFAQPLRSVYPLNPNTSALLVVPLSLDTSCSFVQFGKSKSSPWPIQACPQASLLVYTSGLSRLLQSTRLMNYVEDAACFLGGTDNNHSRVLPISSRASVEGVRRPQCQYSTNP